MIEPDEVSAAEVLLPSADPNEAARFFVDELGFRVEAVRPADDPVEIVLSGYGLRVALRRDLEPGGAGALRLRCRAGEARSLEAPDGTRIELVPDRAPLRIPPPAPSRLVSRLAGARWIEGRASMRYRDLIADRQGGRWVGSHIRIEQGGPVPDYVHHHRVRFQMIFCHRGWVRVAYEDQGPPLTMRPGDCVLQPPGIRHRVLESSEGLEVVEIGCPAAHDTLADHALILPSERALPERRWEGQRFVHHRAAEAEWTAGPPGYERSETAIASATGDLVRVAELRREPGPPAPLEPEPGELRFYFVRGGTVRFGDGALVEGDAVTIGAGLTGRFTEPSADLSMLEVLAPGEPA